MPEGPELRLSGLFVNKFCAGLHFAGKVEKSAVSKNPEVPFSCPDYTISAVSRGKEVKLNLSPVSKKYEPASVLFRFGMSGSFKFTAEEDLPKHAHLRFYTKDRPRRVLSFVDPRRFGSWEFNGSWQPERGPCVMTEYEKFRENVLKNLSDKAFDKPICEALLNQKYFNGIGNYLRAEILHRLHIPPFTQARAVLEDVKHQNQNSDLSLSKKVKIKKENPDILQLCHLVPLEVVDLGGKSYDPENPVDYSAFVKWLQCYFVPGMNTMKDSNGRTIWFQGEPGPLTPKGSKVQKPKRSLPAEDKVKGKKTASKRKSGRQSSTTVKEEQDEDIDGEAEGKAATKRKRGVKVEAVFEEEAASNGQRATRRGKKANKVPESIVSRKASQRGSAKKIPSKRGRATRPQTKDAAAPKTKPQRLKSDNPRNSPKPLPRRLKADTNSTPKKSPVVKTRGKRKSAVRDAESKP